MRVRIAIATAVAFVAASLFGGLAIATSPASAATGSEPCDSGGYSAFCGLDAGMVVSKPHFTSAGAFCVRVKNTYDTRKRVTVDIGKSLGALHKLAAHHAVILCRASIPSGAVRATVRVRDGGVDQSAGTWLIAQDSARRIVVSRKMVATAANPNITLCAKNVLHRKAMLYMYWGDVPVAHTARIRPGRTACTGFQVSTRGHVTVRSAWLNSHGAKWLEAWTARR